MELQGGDGDDKGGYTYGRDGEGRQPLGIQGGIGEGDEGDSVEAEATKAGHDEEQEEAVPAKAEKELPTKIAVNTIAIGIRLVAKKMVVSGVILISERSIRRRAGRPK